MANEKNKAKKTGRSGRFDSSKRASSLDKTRSTSDDESVHARTNEDQDDSEADNQRFAAQYTVGLDETDAAAL